MLGGRNAPSLPGGGGRALGACAARGRGREREPGAASGEAGSFPLFPFASFATLLIEDLHVQFKKPSVGQAGKKGKTLLMRKGNLVPLSLPADWHRDSEWRINSAPPCASGPPAISHAPRAGTGAAGWEASRPPSPLCQGALLSSFCKARVGVAGPHAPEPRAFAFTWVCKPASTA